MTKLKEKPKINIKEIDKIIESHRNKKWGLIPMLQEIQERAGYIPPEVIPRVADAVGLFPSQVQAVITFYSQLYTHPRGKNIVRVCRGTACHVRGGKTILKLVKQHLGIEEGETTEDMEYTLETVACIGVCALAPNLVVNTNIHGNMNPKKVAAIFGNYKGS
ncbi:MAG: NADH-quinone oxidoreductase subunit NuoE [Dehalococcoidales bacterium]|nr:NADH-quinone oxidoreductase subunit NuoE [Dehalococcoidales bacterium]